MFLSNTRGQLDSANDYIEKKKTDDDWKDFDNAMEVAFKAGIVVGTGVVATLAVICGIGIVLLHSKCH